MGESRTVAEQRKSTSTSTSMSTIEAELSMYWRFSEFVLYEWLIVAILASHSLAIRLVRGRTSCLGWLPKDTKPWCR